MKMSKMTRRGFLETSLATSATWTLGAARLSEAVAAGEGDGPLRLAPFRFDVTPPEGHSLCGGWIKPVLGVDDPLWALGLVLLGAGQPIVLCAVDWTGLLNRAHVEWRAALAEAAGTTPDRVAVQCVHQHNAPFACLDAERIVQAQGDLPHIIEIDFFHRCLEAGRAAIQAAIPKARPVTHIASGESQVEKVASNRRVFRDAEGRVQAMRGSSCVDDKLRALPEGLIDPSLKTVAFYDHGEKIAACHYYATHPMSYYGDGRVTSDFAGLARAARQQDEPDCQHIYFTGCAGNISAGKYNDGSKEMRPILTQRVYEAMVRSEEGLRPVAVERVGWRSIDVYPTPRASLSAAALAEQIGDCNNAVVGRNRPSFMLSWLQRVEQKTPIVLSSLSIDQIGLLHLPAECFVQYQLRAQAAAPSKFVATAAYGDGGPWYIPVEEEYARGGYEVGVAFCAPQVDQVLEQGVKMLLG